MTYHDGEKVIYDYGGQLKSMYGDKDNEQYYYINAVKYDKFGAKALNGLPFLPLST